MPTSTVKWFDAKKGYGFIDHPQDGDDVFVHYSQIDTEQEFKTLRTGQSVYFEMKEGPKGLHALHVVPEQESVEQESVEQESVEQESVEPAPSASGAPDETPPPDVPPPGSPW